jgi:hypothetical protein
MTDNPSRVLHGVPVPTFLYGTAWKESATTNLVCDEVLTTRKRWIPVQLSQDADLDSGQHAGFGARCRKSRSG